MGCTLAERLKERLAASADLGGRYRLKARLARRGPGPRALYELLVSDKRVALLLIFCGIKPHYRPWVELYSIDPSPGLDCCPSTPCSSLENSLIDIVAGILEPGSPFYLDYTWDEETMLILGRRVPPTASRLGYKMLRAGFTWLKHWYYPEGFMEGGEKLQGEKPISDEARVRQLREAFEELEGFLSRWRGTSDPVMGRAVEYAEASRRLILNLLSGAKE